jgi:DNA-binding NtrC family response regulator
MRSDIKPSFGTIGSKIGHIIGKGETQMVAVIVQDDLIRQSLQGLLQRTGVMARFYSKISESSAAIMENPAALEAVIIDYDMDPALCKWLIAGIQGLTDRVKILVYTDFPILELGESQHNNEYLTVREKPFILSDILETITSDTRRKHVSL